MPESKQKSKVAVVGSRTFTDKKLLFDFLTRNKEKIEWIVSGGADGADTFAVEWAKVFGKPYLVFPALWKDPVTQKFDRGAGFRRNAQIVEHSDIIIAFWDGISGGTKNTIEIAKLKNKPIKIVYFKDL